MKTLLTLILSLIGYISFSQSIPQNKIFNLDTIGKINPKDSISVSKNADKTSNTAIYKGRSLPVYTSKKGKLFIVVQSEKTKNWYRKYLN